VELVPVEVVSKVVEVLDRIGIPYVLGVVKVQGDRLDKAYLQAWASRLGVEDLLQRALGEA
jgi:arsenate reductase-like glutaredoxin family protein